MLGFCRTESFIPILIKPGLVKPSGQGDFTLGSVVNIYPDLQGIIPLHFKNECIFMHMQYVELWTLYIIT